MTAVASWVTALALVAAGSSKLSDPAAFRAALRSYRLLPNLLLGPLARVVPGIEITLAAVILVSGRAATPARAATVALLVVFVAVQVSAVVRRVDATCGCFGNDPAQDHVGVESIARTAILVVAAAVALRDTSPALRMSDLGATIEAALAASLLALTMALVTETLRVRRQAGSLLEGAH